VYGRARAEWPLRTRNEQADREGFVHIHEEMGWIRVRYIPFDQPLPTGTSHETVYRAYTRDSVFGASPEQLDALLPAYIHAPEEYVEFTTDEHAAFHAMWHGTFSERRPRRDPADGFGNLTRLFQPLDPISDEAWAVVEEYDALCEAVEDGYEDEAVVRSLVSDEYFEARDSDDRYALVERQ
jgi:hypothetical protein